MSRTHIGMSGWTYPPWRGVFYPPKLAQKRELEYASRQVNSIEINGTFYRLQKPETFQQWYEQTPDGFCFAVKATQFITHRLRLKDVAQPLANFFASGLLCLKEKLGPILWQFPPTLPYVDGRFEEFMAMLPRDTQQAAALAARHDRFVEGRSWTEAGGDYPIRHAFEFRHQSFKDADLLGAMREHGIALVLADSGAHSLNIADLTGDYVYVRMHGQGAGHQDGYPDAELQALAARIRAWTQGDVLDAETRLLPPDAKPRDVYVYFDNDEKAHAPLNAMRLTKIMSEQV